MALHHNTIRIKWSSTLSRLAAQFCCIHVKVDNMLQTVSIVLYTIYSNNLILLDIAFIADIIDDYMLPCLIIVVCSWLAPWSYILLKGMFLVDIYRSLACYRSVLLQLIYNYLPIKHRDRHFDLIELKVRWFWKVWSGLGKNYWFCYPIPSIMSDCCK